MLEGYKVAKEIAAHGAGASTFSDWWGYKIEAIDAIPHNAAIMVRKGVLVVDQLRQRRARAPAEHGGGQDRCSWGGLTEDEALAMVTINPAKQLRIDNRVGSLEVGKDADVVIWTHHPLSAYAIVERTYIDGSPYYDRQAEERRLTELQKEKDGAVDGRAQQAARADDRPQTPRAQQSGAGDDSSEASHTPSTRAGTNGSAAAAGPRRRRRWRRTKRGRGTERSAAGQDGAGRAAQNGVLAITNAKIYPGHAAPSSSAAPSSCATARSKRSAPTSKCRRARRSSTPPAADVYPGLHQCERVDRAVRSGRRRLSATTARSSTTTRSCAPRWRSTSTTRPFPVARANGVTTVGVGPAGGILGGQMAVMNLDGWTWEEATVKPNVGVTFRFPAIGGGGGRGGGGGGGGGGQQPDRTYDDVRRERDAQLDADHAAVRSGARVREGGRTQPPHRLGARSAGADRREASAALRVGRQRADDQGRDRVLREGRRVAWCSVGAIEAPLVAPLLKEKNIPVILGNVLSLPSRPTAGMPRRTRRPASSPARA